jgi:hypothetical protein
MGHQVRSAASCRVHVHTLYEWSVGCSGIEYSIEVVYRSGAHADQKKPKKCVKDRIRTCAPEGIRFTKLAGERVNHSTTLTAIESVYEFLFIL